MVKIYAPFKDTWSISKKNLQITKQNDNEEIAKSNLVFTRVYSSLRMADCSDSNKFNQGPSFYFQLYLYGLKRTANLCVCIKNYNYKFWFKNISSLSDKFYLPSYIANLINATDENLEIEVIGMFIVEINEYPAIPSKFCLNEKLWEESDKDFDIIVIDERKNEEKIRINKELLIAYSDAFERMLNSGMKESKTNTLKIIDFNAETVKSAIDFFYGNNIFNSFLKIEDALELLRFADKYFIDNLKDSITTFISYLLTPSNVMEISDLVNASNFVKLQQKCLDFITALKETEYITDGSRTVEEISYE